MIQKLTIGRAMLLLRIAVSSIFFVHALVRILNHSINRFGDFLNQKGFLYGVFIVWMITAFELAGSIMMALGIYVRHLAIGFIGLLLVGILVIHASLGWFVGEHGTGGMEYSVILIFSLIAIIGWENNKINSLPNNK